MPPDLLACAEAGCDVQFPPRPGRGLQSRFCELHRARRRHASSKIRNFRHSLTVVNEWMEALGAEILSRKEDIEERQQRHCYRCDRRRKLYLARDEADNLIGLCITCHSAWVAERRNASGNRTRR